MRRHEEMEDWVADLDEMSHDMKELSRVIRESMEREEDPSIYDLLEHCPAILGPALRDIWSEGVDALAREMLRKGIEDVGSIRKRITGLMLDAAKEVLLSPHPLGFAIRVFDIRKPTDCARYIAKRWVWFVEMHRHQEGDEKVAEVRRTLLSWFEEPELHFMGDWEDVVWRASLDESENPPWPFNYADET